MPQFIDTKKIKTGLYVVNDNPIFCFSETDGRTPPLVSKNPLTLCTCHRCYPLAKTVVEHHGEKLGDWINDPGKWK